MKYRFSTDISEMDIDMIHHYLAGSYWAKGVPLKIVRKAVANSLSFGVFEETKQLGFGRFITDRATFAYLADVFVLPAYRGRGLSRLMLDAVLEHSDLQGLRRLMLATKDAHGLYEKYGFEPLSQPEMFMQLWVPNVYQAEL